MGGGDGEREGEGGISRRGGGDGEREEERGKGGGVGWASTVGSSGGQRRGGGWNGDGDGGRRLLEKRLLEVGDDGGDR